MDTRWRSFKKLVGLIVLPVAMEVDELVRLDAQRPRNRQELLPVVTGVIRG